MKDNFLPLAAAPTVRFRPKADNRLKAALADNGS